MERGLRRPPSLVVRTAFSDGTVIEPCVNFRTDGKHDAVFLCSWTAHREVELHFPSLHGADAAIEVVSNIFPGVEEIGLTDGGHGADCSGKTQVMNRSKTQAAGAQECCDSNVW